MKIKELSPEDRPREKMLEKGAGSLSTAELIAILLRTGTGKSNAVDTARKLLNMAGGNLTGLYSLSVEKMCGITGIGQGKAITVAAAIELGRRFGAETSRIEKISVTSPDMIYRMMLPKMKGLGHEECWVVYLNRANYITGCEQASRGGLDATTVDIKIIVRKALEKLASGIILIHNHPSGNPMPGTADINMTGRLKKALETFDISLTDHIIVCDDRYYSFADERATVTGTGK